MNRSIKKYLPYFTVALLSSLFTVGLMMEFIVPKTKFSTTAAALNSNQFTIKKMKYANEQVIGSDSIILARKKIAPSVVYIDTVSVVSSQPMLPFGLGDFFPREFFEGRQQEQRGTGSGFIIKPNGYILTNEHVVRGAQKLTVTLFGGKKFTGKVIGVDAATDLAVVKIEATKLPSVVMGNSDQLEPGQWVVAIGNPYGLHDTVTAGIISALGRSLEDPDVHGNLIQTDAAINPGNSGGPLIDLSGQVIGINEAIVANAQSIGFAIPINTAAKIADELIKHGKVQRQAGPWLGVGLTEINQQIAEYYGLNSQDGAIIQVFSDTPADKAGLRDGDIIKEINRQKIATPNDVLKFMKKAKVGQKIEILIYREGKLLVFKVELAEKPANLKSYRQ
jgi:serine protease Do